MEDEITIRVLKGSQQIGGCITEIQSKKAKIIIDFGEDLEDKEKAKVPQIEGLTCNPPRYDAVFITHSHQDHIGWIDKILEEIPVYVEEKSQKIYELTCAFTGKPCRKKVERIQRKKGKQDYEPVTVGDMQVQYYKIDHSAYNSCMVLITCQGKRILHTGDFRSHGYKGKDFIPTLQRIREQGRIDYLITEGTVLGRGDIEYQKEEDLKKEAIKIFQKYNQVFVLQSSTNIDRLTSFCKASFATKKKFIEDVFTANITLELGGRIPNPTFDSHKVSVWTPFVYWNKPEEFQKKYIKPLEKYKWVQNVYKDYCMLVKTSMYEDIKMLVQKGRVGKACLVYSMWNGYLEKPEIKEFVQKVKDLRIDYIELHTSGHADLKTMKLVEKILKPRNVIVLHTTDAKKAKDVFKNVIEIKDGEKIKVERGMKTKDFIKRYLEKKGYFYRLRGVPGEEEMLVYYQGVKIFELQKGQLFVPSIKFYLPNSKNNPSKTLPEQVVDDYKAMKAGGKVFSISYKGEIFKDYPKFYETYRTERGTARFIGKDIGDITRKELEEIEKILERRIDIYSNKEKDTRDFGPTTKDEKGKEEKEYQLKLMNSLNNEKEKEKILSDFVSKDTLPFEMEYGIKTKEKVKAFAGKAFVPEGRIDNILFDGETVELVEIKMGTKVIAGTNGIHKHLIDIAQSCTRNHIMVAEDFEKIAKEKDEILRHYGLEVPPRKTLERLEYSIVCGYKNEKEKEEVERLLRRIYRKDMGEVMLMTKNEGKTSKSIKKEGKIEEMKKEENYGADLMSKNIPELLAIVEKDCPTKIYLASQDFRKVEEFVYPG